MSGIKYYQLAKGEELPDEFCAVRDIGGEPSEYTFYAPEAENAKLRELAFGMYGLLEMFDRMLGNHDACETPRPLVFGEDKSFKDVMQDLGIEVDG